MKKGSQYNILNTIDISEISFKTTGTIDTDLDTDITINVKKENPLEDAIEKGMHVKVKNLSIEGSIGPGTKITAQKVDITGQTHTESSIECDNAHLGLHKGKITCRKAEINTLEGGEIIADEVIIKSAMGGKIRAKRITIEILGAHVVMEASQVIEIKRVKGEENKFIFDASINKDFSDDTQEDENTLQVLKDDIKPFILEFQKLTQRIKKNLEPCKKVKAKIINFQKR